MASSTVAVSPSANLTSCTRWPAQQLKAAPYGLPALLKPCRCEGPPRSRSIVPKASHEEPPLGRRDALFVGVAGAALSALVGAAVMLQPVDVAQAYLGGGPYGRQVTRGQDLSGQDFSNLDLTGQDFKTSILRQANFKNAKLAGASFFDADLAGADFSNADLRGADFSLCRATQVNFTGAIFEGATVTGNTQFKGSNVKDTDFTDVGLRNDQRKLLCKVASGTNPVTGVDTRESLLCGD